MAYLTNAELFKKYRSNTVAASGNQNLLVFDEKTQITGKMFFKVKKYGKFNYRLFFSNITDSTFADGILSKCNMSGDEYYIKEAYIGSVVGFDPYQTSESRIQLTFNGQKQKKVEKWETYWSDEVEINVEEGHILCFEWTVEGTKFPNAPEKVTSAYIKKEDGTYFESPDCPHPSLIGCDYHFEKNIAFIGDSITMGCGTTKNAYRNWVSFISDSLGEDFSVWNLGLGYARAYDAATDKVWLEKAKQYDFVSVCMGVNDLLRERTAEDVKNDLTTIVESLRKANVKIGIFTVPCFDWEGEIQGYWDDVNDYIRNVLSEKCEYVFDMATYTSRGGNERYKSRYGGHPNDLGCEIVAKKFIEEMEDIL